MTGKSPLITFILGTRPEAIKLAPLINLFKENSFFEIRVVITGQHREMVYEVLNIFEIKPDIDLKIMRENQTLNKLNSIILESLEIEFDKFLPDIVIVQGDTTTAYAAAMASFYKKIKIAHVEAGLRTENLYSPFPEEANRRLISQISDFHFAPTKLAEENLIKSKVPGKVFLTGNTVIDALLYIANKNKIDEDRYQNKTQKIILVTIHRRENWGSNIEDVCDGLKKLLDNYSDIRIILPMHPNKIIRDSIIDKLGVIDRVSLIEPLKYPELIEILKVCYLVLTDSGGIQEEAPSLGKPVLVLRDNTERIEGIKNGTAKLVGTRAERIFKEVKLLIDNSDAYKKMSEAKNPYGDGKACEKILKIFIKEFFNSDVL